MNCAKLTSPTRGCPKLCDSTTYLFPYFIFISKAEIIDRAAPKLCPVHIIFLTSYFAANFSMFSMSLSSRSLKSRKNPACIQHSLHFSQGSIQKLKSSYQLGLLDDPRSESITDFVSGRYPIYPATIVRLSQRQVGSRKGSYLEPRQFHFYTQVCPQNASEEYLALITESVRLYQEAYKLSQVRLTALTQVSVTTRNTTNFKPTLNDYFILFYVDKSINDEHSNPITLKAGQQKKYQNFNR